MTRGGDAQWIIRTGGDFGPNKTQFWFDRLTYEVFADCDLNGEIDSDWLVGPDEENPPPSYPLYQYCDTALPPQTDCAGATTGECYANKCRWDKNDDGIPDTCQDCDDDCGGWPVASTNCLDPVEIALGTDGAASNDLLDPFEEMRCGLLLQKVAHQDPTVLGARDAFRFATEGGARACRLDAGTLDEGRLADVVLVDLSGPHTFRLTDEIISCLVHCAKSSDVETVIVNGEIVMRDREIQTVDETAVLREAKRVGERYGI